MLSIDYEMLRVSKRHPCAICGKPDWCGYSPDERLAVCMRVADGAMKQTANGGYLHVLRDDPDWRIRPKQRSILLERNDSTRADMGRQAAGYAAAVDITELHDFADELGLCLENLVRLGIGWAAEHRAWAFPMRGADMRVRGIRLRSWTGRKWAVRGGREGLFLPTGRDFTKPLLIAEGPTDSAALLDLGFEAVGRPSCTGGTKRLVELVGQTRPPGVIIVADQDGPGERGAEALTCTLLAYAPSVRVIRPPAGMGDARAWKQAGATRADVQAVIDAAPERSLRLTREGRAGR